LVVSVADQMGAAIERLRAEAAARQRIQELQVISRISRDITSALDQPSVVNSIVRAAADKLEADASGLYLLREDGRLYLAAAYGVGEEYIKVTNQEGLAVSPGTAVGQAVQTGKTVQFEDLYAHPGYTTHHLARMENIHAILAAPLLRGDERVGGIVIWHRHPYRFSVEEETFLQALANQCVNAVENARLFEVEREQRQLAEVLRATGSVLSANLDRNSLFDALLVQVERLLPYDAANFTLLENGMGHIARWRGYEKFGQTFIEALENLLLPIADLPNLRRIVENRRADVISDTSLDPEWVQLDTSHPIRSWLGAPVIINGEVVALFSLDSATPGFFQAHHTQRIETLAGQASLALQNVRMFEEIQAQASERRASFLAAQEQAARMVLLAHLSEQLNYPRRVNEVILAIGQGAMQLARADMGAVYVGGATLDVALCAWYSGLSESYINKILQEFPNVPGWRLRENVAPIIIPDIHALPEESPLRRLGEPEGFCSVALWPLVYEGRVAAAVGLYHVQPGGWTPGMMEVMTAFTRQAAVALQNARLFEETHRRAAQQETLNRVIAAAAGAMDVPDLMNSVLDLAMGVLEVELGGIWVEEACVLRGFSSDMLQICTAEKTITSLHLHQTVMMADWEQPLPDEDMSSHQDFMRKMGIRASLAAPLLRSGQHTGQMIFAAVAPREWTVDEVTLAETIGRQVGSALERLGLLAQLQEQARQIESILNTVPEGVVVVNTAGKISLANPAALLLLPNLVENFNPEAPLTLLAHRALGALWDDDSSLDWKEIYVSGPTPRTYEVARRALRAGREPGHWLLVLRDVTQERNNLARVQMQERLATVGQLAAGIAHDFNNIMAAVVVYADLLAMQPNLTAAGREHLHIIQEQVQRATTLIRQILDFSRRTVLEPSPLDLLPFLKEFEKLLIRILPETIQVRLSHPGGQFMVKADPVRLQQVFMNLALNARDAIMGSANTGGGEMHFSLGRLHLSEGDPLPLPDMGAGYWITITIQDNGSGIEPELLPHIFDPFFTTKPVGKGTGLGLSQVYGIVKQHGGAIDVQSIIGRGSLFTIYLPALANQPADDSNPSHLGTIPKLCGQILLVEDDQAARAALEALLQGQGLQVMAAENGKAALRLYGTCTSPVDLVISDVVMPEMGGLALYRALQQRQPGLKFLFITGHPQEDQAGLPIGDDNVQVLLKPFLVQDLIRIVQEILPRS
jgi:GAF domain-containing protein/nitrogen-specific signal transduction histidine kinase/CheY-like chemotaxis protein